MIPQIIYLVLLAIGFGLLPKEKGKEKKHSLLSDTFAMVFTQGLFYWGGFYQQTEWPQVVMFGYILIILGVSAYQHGTTTVKKGLTFISVLVTVLQIIVLWYGGFFKPIQQLF